VAFDDNVSYLITKSTVFYRKFISFLIIFTCKVFFVQTKWYIAVIVLKLRIFPENFRTAKVRNCFHPVKYLQHPVFPDAKTTARLFPVPPPIHRRGTEQLQG